jgi:hypothetical protein
VWNSNPAEPAFDIDLGLDTPIRRQLALDYHSSVEVNNARHRDCAVVEKPLERYFIFFTAF